MQPLLTMDDIADRLRLSRRHLARLRADGKFPAPDLTTGRRIRWRVETVERWLEAAKGVTS